MLPDFDHSFNKFVKEKGIPGSSLGACDIGLEARGSRFFGVRGSRTADVGFRVFKKAYFCVYYWSVECC